MEYALTDRNFSVIGLGFEHDEPGDRIRYEPYGLFRAFPAGDVNLDGTVNGSDVSAILFAAGYEAELDLDMDGSVGSKDSSLASGLSGRTLVQGQLSDSGNIVGWCGYLYEESTGMWLARHRWQIPELGRWANRDPIGYAGGSQNLYEYVNGMPIWLIDPFGLEGWWISRPWKWAARQVGEDTWVGFAFNTQANMIDGAIDIPVDVATGTADAVEGAAIFIGVGVGEITGTEIVNPERLLETSAGQVIASCEINGTAETGAALWESVKEGVSETATAIGEGDLDVIGETSKNVGLTLLPFTLFSKTSALGKLNNVLPNSNKRGGAGSNQSSASRPCPVKIDSCPDQKPVHKNSNDYVGDTHVYRIIGPDGETYKIGESAQGVRKRDGKSIRAEQQVRELLKGTGEYYTSEIWHWYPGKQTAKEFETQMIDLFRRVFGPSALPGNKTNR